MSLNYTERIAGASNYTRSRADRFCDALSGAAVVTIAGVSFLLLLLLLSSFAWHVVPDVAGFLSQIFGG